MISEIMKYNNSTDEIDYLYEYLNNKTDNKFIANFTHWVTSNEYDRDSLIDDIGEDADKNQSNFHTFLRDQNKSEYFDTIYELFKSHQQQQINQQNCAYWLKLFQNFCLAQIEFVSIKNPFKIPKDLQKELFADENKNSTNLISITKLKDI
eukprot:89387_1